MKKWLIASMLLAACSEGEQRVATVPQTTKADADSACAQFTRDGLKLKAKSLIGLRAEAGTPARKEVRVEPNRHVPNVHDSIFRFEYDGMIVTARKPGPGGDMIEQVIVSKRKWLNYPYFQPGVAIENVIAVLGEPRRDGNRMIYSCSGEAEEPVVFETEDGTVKQIIFNNYVD